MQDSGRSVGRLSLNHALKMVVFSFVVFTVALLSDAPWKGFTQSRRVEFSAEPVRVASSLWRDGTFANPFATPTGYTAHVAPGLPFLQSLVLRFVGGESGGWLIIRSLPSLALSLQLALLPWLAIDLGYSAETGSLASLLGLLVKPGLEEHWEAHLAGLAGLLLTAAACVWLRRERPLGWAIATGALAGLAIHLNPLLGMVYLLWDLSTGHSPGYFTRKVLPLWITPLLLMTPWTIRNLTVMRGLFPIRDDLGLELYVSYNDCAPYGFRESLKESCIQLLHPNSSMEEALAVRTLGEYEYNQIRFHKALLWIGSHPARTSSLTLQRIWFFWFPSESGIEGDLLPENSTDHN